MKWDDEFKRAVEIVQKAFNRRYTTSELATLETALRGHVVQEMRLHRIAERVAESYERYSNRLPEPAYWLKCNKDLPWVAPNTYGRKCPKCEDRGCIEIEMMRGSRLYHEVAMCNCSRGDLRQAAMSKPVLTLESLPRIADAIHRGFIQFGNGYAMVRGDGNGDRPLRLYIRQDREEVPFDDERKRY